MVRGKPLLGTSFEKSKPYWQAKAPPKLCSKTRCESLLLLICDFADCLRTLVLDQVYLKIACRLTTLITIMAAAAAAAAVPLDKTYGLVDLPLELLSILCQQTSHSLKTIVALGAVNKSDIH